jgi:hypothetical protein
LASGLIIRELNLATYGVGVPYQNGPNSGSDIFVPLDFIIGGRETAGQCEVEDYRDIGCLSAALGGRDQERRRDSASGVKQLD